MPALYRLAIIHSGRDALADEIGRAAREAVAAILKRHDLFEVTDTVPDTPSGSSLVVAFLASPTRGGNTADDAMQKALEFGIPVLPVYRSSDAERVAAMLPRRITHLNAVDWDQNRPLALAALLRLLGLVEDERRVFLSYVRRDAAGIAEQLHRALQERQFDVFLDRFSVPPGDDFTRRLTEDLADKAFMLLLESNGVRESRWVQYEITYALSHRLAVLATTLPGVDEASFAPVDEAFRYRLTSNDIEGQELTDVALDQLLEQIELTHARALQRRREQLLGSLIDHLEADGCSCNHLADWAIVATAENRTPSAFLVTPRSPRTADLRSLDAVRQHAREATGIGGMDAALVHDVADISVRQTDLLDWVAESRDLAVGRIFDSRLEATA